MLAPPGQPPVVSPQEIEAYRKRTDAEYLAKNGPDAYRRAAEQQEVSNRAQWLARAEAARPPAIPVRFPTIEPTAGFRAGVVARKDYGHVGPEVGLTVRFDERFAFDLPVALMQTYAGSLGQWATIGASPSFIVSQVFRGGLLYARIGPDVLIPRGASGAAPNMMIGGHIGGGVIGHITSLPNYGYVGVGVDMRYSLRGGVGGPESLLDAPRFGVDLLVTLRVAF